MASSTPGNGRIKGRGRVSNACQRCRKHKIKCSGTMPCRTCDERSQRCIFNSDNKKVVISESVLRDLKTRVHDLERQQRPNPLGQQSIQNLRCLRDTASGLHSEGTVGLETSSVTGILQSSSRLSALSRTTTNKRPDIAAAVPTPPMVLLNPLAPKQPTYIVDSFGRMRYLGHSSTWAFSQQLLHMVHRSPNFTSPVEIPSNIEGEAYHVNATRPVLNQQDLVGLPSLELSLLYVQNVKFRTYPLYYLFDESTFMSSIYDFYENMSTYAQAHPLWFVHYLLVISFGKAFSAQRNSGVAGSELFDRALRMLPDVTALCFEGVEATEVLCCIALYLESIDHRMAAHIYVGQALRMALSHGLHTDIQASVAGIDHVMRCRRVWWSVYTLDRRLSSSMGNPCGLHDEDVTAPFPSQIEGRGNSKAQNINVKICQLLGRILNTLYSTDGSLNKTFLTTAEEVLRGVAGLADELAQFSESCVGEISRVAAHLNLAYHQCIVLATRPFLFHLSKIRLESSTVSNIAPLTQSVKGLVQVCIDSAVQAVTTLSKLREHDLLDSFLPFDLESNFSSSLILVIAAGVHPKLLPQENFLDSCFTIFDYMSDRGNILAGMQKSVVQQIAPFGYGASRRSHETHNGHGHSTSTNKTLSSVAAVVQGVSPATTSATDHASLPSLGDPFFDEWIADDGFSGAQILDLADALTAHDMDFEI